MPVPSFCNPLTRSFHNIFKVNHILNRKSFSVGIRTLFLLTIHVSLLTILPSCQKEKVSLSFSRLTSGTTDDLDDILFLNDSIGYACGGLRYDKGDILKTIDGGFTWVDQSDSNMTKELYHLNFLSKDTGLSCGYDGKIFRTYDGGMNWQYLQTYYYRPIRSVFMLNANKGFACGGDGFNHGYQLQTSTADTWQVDTSNVEYRDLFFFDEFYGVMCGYGLILRTSDGGESWTYTNAKQDFFVAMNFVNDEIGFAIGYTGSIWKTNDGGENWERLRNSNVLFTPRWYFNCIEFRDANVGYIAGERGCILKTEDGGDHWDKVENSPDVDWLGISLVSNGGFLCGTGGTIYRFVDK